MRPRSPRRSTAAPTRAVRAGRWWTLDPVDGTKGFLRDGSTRSRWRWSVDGEVVLGVLGCPNLAVAETRPMVGRGSLFVAEPGGGAWELPLDRRRRPAEPGRRVRVADITDPSQARYAESVEAAHSAQDEAALIAARLGMTAPPVRMDSQAKYGLVARGDASIYLRIPHGDYVENVWDHAAGAIVVREAGGIVSRRRRPAARLHDRSSPDPQPRHHRRARRHPRPGRGRRPERPRRALAAGRCPGRLAEPLAVRWPPCRGSARRHRICAGCMNATIHDAPTVDFVLETQILASNSTRCHVDSRAPRGRSDHSRPALTRRRRRVHAFDADRSADVRRHRRDPRPR